MIVLLHGAAGFMAGPLPMRHSSLRTARPNLIEDEPVRPTNKTAPPPFGIHPGVLCDATLNPITGYRYTKIGSRPSYDLCQEAYDELEPAEAAQFERYPPPITPRRTLVAMAALALGIALSRALPGAPTAPKRNPRLFYEDFVEIPPLSPAEQLVALFFRPQVMATQREAAPTAERRAARASSPQMSAAATSLACADEPPPLRAPSLPPPSFLPAPLRRRWRAALGCEFCADSMRVPCPNCDAKGGYLAMGGTPAVCKACRGTGRVVCRECFTGDGFDIESIRRQMGYPD